MSAVLDESVMLAEYARLREKLEPTPSEADLDRAWNSGRTTGHVYFIQQGDEGPIKIGYARDVPSRLEALQVGNAELLHVRLAVAGVVADERAFHEQFEFAHIRGEWFRPCVDLLDFITHCSEFEDEAA